mmetsp:Transcript_100726/g.291174  ORF Transcript_100726/g.291174 Transcript_100726/m.291174 type:complete len:471 (-) Transcript_100726:4357-5769(-)
MPSISATSSLSALSGPQTAPKRKVSSRAEGARVLADNLFTASVCRSMRITVGTCSPAMPPVTANATPPSTAPGSPTSTPGRTAGRIRTTVRKPPFAACARLWSARRSRSRSARNAFPKPWSPALRATPASSSNSFETTPSSTPGLTPSWTPRSMYLLRDFGSRFSAACFTLSRVTALLRSLRNIAYARSSSGASRAPEASTWAIANSRAARSVVSWQRAVRRFAIARAWLNLIEAAETPESRPRALPPGAHIATFFMAFSNTSSLFFAISKSTSPVKSSCSHSAMELRRRNALFVSSASFNLPILCFLSNSSSSTFKRASAMPSKSSSDASNSAARPGMERAVVIAARKSSIKPVCKAATRSCFAFKLLSLSVANAKMPESTPTCRAMSSFAVISSMLFPKRACCNLSSASIRIAAASGAFAGCSDAASSALRLSLSMGASASLLRDKMDSLKRLRAPSSIALREALFAT